MEEKMKKAGLITLNLERERTDCARSFGEKGAQQLKSAGFEVPSAASFRIALSSARSATSFFSPVVLLLKRLQLLRLLDGMGSDAVEACWKFVDPILNT